MGTDHSSDNVSLVEVQISMPPCPPARFDVMNASRPSFRMKIRVSRPGLLNSGTSIPRPENPSSYNGLAYTSSSSTRPGRVMLPKNSQACSVLGSSQNAGAVSSKDVLRTHPKLVGSCQGECLFRRRVIQISPVPLGPQFPAGR